MDSELLDELSEILAKKQENFNRCIVLIDKLLQQYEQEQELNALLSQRIRELEVKIIELESRPPSDGGAIYQSAKEHFVAEAIKN